MRKIKNIISSAIIAIVRTLNGIDLWLTGYAYNPNPKKFDDLAPATNADVGEGYAQALEWALRNSRINNIAITGPYGSGKSSVLRTFVTNHPEYRYLQISLASFDSSEEEPEKANTIVEKSILQQIFYQVKGEVVPYSRFKRIKDIGQTKLVVLSLGFVAWLVALFYLLIVGPIGKASIENYLGYKNFDENQIILIAVSVVLTGVFFLIKFLLSFFGYSKFSKISTAVGEIEFDEGSGVSVLNKHLDEILYFFEKTKYNVVIVEDLDRFDEIDIFENLREINGLINNSKQVDRRIVFIYAIRDDFFQGSDRTKFFDYIIPVIPVIDSSNSGEKLLEKLKDLVSSGEISKEFIYDVTFHIDDMRMLKNIYNEFVIYKSKLSGINLNLNNLFGFIVYKNLFPSDYSSLHKNMGMVANAFEKKTELVNEYLSDIHEKINILQDKIETVSKEHAKDLIELRSIYVMRFIKKIQNPVRINIHGKDYSLAQLIDDEVIFRNFRGLGNIQYDTVNKQRSNSGISFSSIEEEVNSEVGYEERKSYIDDRRSGELEELKHELEAAKKTAREIRSISLKDFVDTYPEVDLFSGYEQRNVGLLRYLVHNGYIDEMYHSFISYFYEGNLTKQDIDFIFSIKNKKLLNYDYKLNNIEEIINRISLAEFSKPETLNFDLLDFLLLSTDKEDETYLDTLMDQICNSNEKYLEFIDDYFNASKNLGNFVKKITSRCDRFWGYIVGNTDYTVDKKNHYLLNIIKHSNIEDIKKLNRKGVLADYLSRLDNFLVLVNDYAIDPEKVKEILKVLNVKFMSINSPDVNPELFNYIYEGSFYKINHEMLSTICNFESEKLLANKSEFYPCYKAIIECEKPHLLNYINENIEEYIEHVYLAGEKECEEEENSIKILLNNENITDENKQSIIDKSKFTINDISTVNPVLEIWGKLFNTKKIGISWENVLHYYELSENFDSTLVGYLSDYEVYTELKKQKLLDYEKQFKESIHNFFESMVKSSHIDFNAYQGLIKSVSNVGYDFSINDIVEPRIEILINNGIIELNKSNITILLEKSIEIGALLVEKNFEKFIEIYDELDIDEELVYSILASSNIDVENKLLLIRKLNSSLYDTNPRIVRLINELIINDQSKTIFDIERIKSLIINEKDPAVRVRLVASQIPLYSNDGITIMLDALGGYYKEINQEGRRPLIQDTEYNMELAIELKKSGYISSYSEFNENIRINTKRST